jgi:hypothetical protein
MGPSLSQGRGKKARISIFFMLVLTMVALPALAIMPPPAKLLDNKVTPACVKAKGSLLSHEQGPAVSLINKCAYDVVMSGLAEHDAKSPEKEVDDIGLVLATRTAGYVQYIDLRLKTDGADCFADALPAKKDELSCKTVLVRPADALIFPVAWGRHYSITGKTADKKEAFHATGWLINANDPAQAMEIIQHETGTK